MLVLFQQVQKQEVVVPDIAVNGLSDVWTLYLPLALFTVASVFFFTRKRVKPDWSNFSINRQMLGRDITLGVLYLLLAHTILGNFLNTGLHFPGPVQFMSGETSISDLVRWAVLQSFFFVLLPYLWLKRQGFSLKRLIAGIDWKRDIWIIVGYWLGDFFGVVAISDFSSVSASEYWYAIPIGVLFNTFGAGLPVLLLIHIILIPRLSLLLNNQLLVIFIGGFLYACFSLFDPGVSYATLGTGAATITYIFATQTLIGMGKAVFTVRTGNPFIHFTSYHILGARVAFDTAMYADLFKRS